MKHVKSLLITLAGIVMGVIVMNIVHLIGYYIYPPPQNLNLTLQQGVEKMVINARFGTFVFLLIGNQLGTASGAFLSGYLAPSKIRKHGIIIGIIFLLGAIIHLIRIPHPVPFVIIDTILYIPMAFMGVKFAKKIQRVSKNRDC